MERLKQYLDTYLLKDQEYKLERGLKKLSLKEAQDKLTKIADQLSIGPFTCRIADNVLRIHIDNVNTEAGVWLTQNGQIRSEEAFLKRLTNTLSAHIQWDEPEKREADKGYISLIVHIVEDANVYERIKAAYECQEKAKKELEDINKNFRNWIAEIWEELHRVAKNWYTRDNIKPGTQIEVLNLKNYTSQVKPVWKITESKSGTKIVFRDNTRIDFSSPRVATVGIWILAHSEYRPLLDYLRKKEDELVNEERF